MTAHPEQPAVVRRLQEVPELPWWAPEFVVNLWNLVRRGMEPSPEEEATALALLDHPDLAMAWEYEEDLPPEFLVDGVNLKLHLLTHQMVEMQLLQNDPPEAIEAVAHLLAIGLERHRAIHLVAEALVEAMYDAATRRETAVDDRYIAHLRSLKRARVATGETVRLTEKVGRNDPCPCGSGKKYKRCCGADGPGRLIQPSEGQMILAAGAYATFGYLETLPVDHPLVVLENLNAVAEAMEADDCVYLAAEARRRLVRMAEALGEGELKCALQDQLDFALNHPEQLDDGVAAATRLIELAEDEEEANGYRLDLADLYDLAGQTEQAEQIYRAVLATDPADPWCHIRWARYLAEHGDLAEAEAVYLRVIEAGGMGDQSALKHAQRELAELQAPDADGTA